MSSETLSTLLSATVPLPFIYLHHPHHPPASLVLNLPPHARLARIDAIEHHSPRLLYSGILNALGGNADSNGSWDGFVRSLRSVATRDVKGKGKGKGKANGNGNLIGKGSEVTEDTAVVILITKAERLRTVLGSGWTVITRLAELAGLPVTLVLASSIPWDDVRPPRADAAEPIHVFLPPPTREEIMTSLLSGSPHPLYPRFLDLVTASVHPLTPSPLQDIEYIAQILWPIYTSPLPPHLESTHLPHFPSSSSSTANPAPALIITVKLLTDLKHNLSIPLSTAIESLLTRQAGGQELLNAFGKIPRGTMRVVQALDLPVVGRYLVVAAYCASYNPVKSDLRLFGRGAGIDGKRRRGGGTRRVGYGRTRVGKVPQRLLGPKPFGLDRILALFASIYAEHAPRPEDLQARFGGTESSSDESDSGGDAWPVSVSQAAAKAARKRAREVERDQRWEDEVDHLTMSVKLWSLLPELEAQGLLKRISPPDRLDNIMLRCEVDYETTKTLAKDLKIVLDEYLYEATS